jgi:hypothetical protein
LDFNGSCPTSVFVRCGFGLVQVEHWDYEGLERLLWLWLEVFAQWCKVKLQTCLRSVVMEIASVGASGAYMSSSVQSARPSQPQEAQAAQAIQRVSEARPESQAQVQQVMEALRPVVNLDGQSTGTTINTTA